jgi:hypothetical protein
MKKKAVRFFVLSFSSVTVFKAAQFGMKKGERKKTFEFVRPIGLQLPLNDYSSGLRSACSFI